MPEKKTCFVVMGFGEKVDFETGRKLDLDASYQNLIKPAVEAAGLECVRADEIVHSGVIDVPMYRAIAAAPTWSSPTCRRPTATPSTNSASATPCARTPPSSSPRTGSSFPFDIGHVVVRTVPTPRRRHRRQRGEEVHRRTHERRHGHHEYEDARRRQPRLHLPPGPARLTLPDDMNAMSVAASPGAPPARPATSKRATAEQSHSDVDAAGRRGAEAEQLRGGQIPARNDVRRAEAGRPLHHSAPRARHLQGQAPDAGGGASRGARPARNR